MGGDNVRESILDALGLFYLPDNISVTRISGSPIMSDFFGNPYSGDGFYIKKHDEKGDVVFASHIPSLATQERTAGMIIEKLKQRLIFHGAIPKQNGWTGTVNKLSPGEEFLLKAGIPTPLPHHIKALKETRGDMPYLIVKLDALKHEVLIELRQTGVRTKADVIQDVRRTFAELGVAPVMG